MRRPADLPLELRGRAFGIHESEAVTPSRLRSSDLWIPARGVRLPRESRSLADLCAAHALTLPAGSAFSGITAARLVGLPLPRWAQSWRGIDVCVPRGTRAPRRTGVVAHQRTLEPGAVIELAGLAVTAPPRTFRDLASTLPLDALVAAGDRIVSRRAPLATLDMLDASIAGWSGRGARRAREALTLLDDGSESAKETELRLLLLRAGIGQLAANHTIRDPQGRFVARVDLTLVHLRIAIEYEGDHHRDPAQWRHDIARRRRLEALGWTYVPVTQADLSDPRSVLADLRAAIASRS